MTEGAGTALRSRRPGISRSSGKRSISPGRKRGKRDEPGGAPVLREQREAARSRYRMVRPSHEGVHGGGREELQGRGTGPFLYVPGGRSPCADVRGGEKGPWGTARQ